MKASGRNWQQQIVDRNRHNRNVPRGKAALVRSEQL